MTKEKAIDLLGAIFVCMVRVNKDSCNWDCSNCPLNYKKGNIIEQIDALSTALKALESYGGDTK